MYLSLETLLAFVPIRQSVLKRQVKKRISKKCHWKQSCQQWCTWSHYYSHFITRKKLCWSCCSRLPSGLKVLVFDAVSVPDEVAPISKSQDEDGPNVF